MNQNQISHYVRPMPNRNVAQVEAIENGFLVRFHEAIERQPKRGLAGKIESEVHRELETSLPTWTTREVALYCAGVEEVKEAVERASGEYGKLSELAAKGDLDHAGGSPF